MNRVHVIVPAGIDDPRRPSGGNAYDRRRDERRAGPEQELPCSA